MDAQARLDACIDRFTPAVAAQGRAVLAWLDARLPGAIRLVYDNYNALAVAYAAGEKLATVALSVAFYPRWVSLFFMMGTQLPDPAGLLSGSGGKMRHIRIDDLALLDDPALADLLGAALALSPLPDGPGGLIIKSISAKQRPRR
jgi:hypothetical protein